MMVPVRVWLKKCGDARFISHLDMVRTFTRVIKRSGLPIWYTEGFNPHPYFTFLRPLSLYIEGLNEPVDMRLTEEMPFDAVREALAGVMPPGIETVQVAAQKNKPVDIAFAGYEISMKFQNMTAEESCAALKSCVGASLTAVKKTKRSQKEIDMSDCLDTEKISVEDGLAKIGTVLMCGNDNNVNPSLVVEACENQLHLKSDDIYIRRIQFYKESMEIFE